MAVTLSPVCNVARGGCGAAVVWAVNIKTDKPSPLNVDPDPNGNLIFTDDGMIDGLPYYRVLLKDEDPGPDVPRYTTHFSTCPSADRFRRRK